MVVTLTAPRTSSVPAPSPAPWEPVLTTSMECMTAGSSPLRKKRRVGEDEVNEARAETVTGPSLSSDTLNAPEAGVVRPVRPTAEPGRRAGDQHTDTARARRGARRGRGREREGGRDGQGRGEERRVGKRTGPASRGGAYMHSARLSCTASRAKHRR